jgi:hypothetical protein
MNKPKSEFSLRSYGKLIREINNDCNILEHDWREVLESAFELTADQRKSISSVPDSIVVKTQESFDAALQHVRKGGKLKTRIQTKDDGRHELNFLLEDSTNETGLRG